MDIGARVKIENFGSRPSYGVFLGLLSPTLIGCDRCEGDSPLAVVRIDNHGLMLDLFHPSRVQLLTAKDVQP